MKMKLDRLPSTTRSLSRETVERARAGAGESRWRVDAIEGTDADRERSLRQELEAAKTRHPGAEAGDQPLQEAREVAEKLVHLGKEASQLLKPTLANPLAPSVDTEA